jgi:3-oxoacyl-[acyl-carrier protein] reductase
MSDELPYITSKGALHQVTPSLADALADRGTTVNCINPGPVDTGWACPTLRAQVKTALPSGRWTTPEETAAVVAWLATPDSQPITGQIINTKPASEGASSDQGSR